MALAPVSQLNPFPGNARRGNVDLIADSLAKLGQYKPIVVCRGDVEPELANTVLAGNHTLQAAIRLGWEQIDVHWVDVDWDTARRIVLVDNRANDKAGYDTEALADLLTELPDLKGTGFIQDDVDRLLDSMATAAIRAAEGLGEGEPSLDVGRTLEDADEDAGGPEQAAEPMTAEDKAAQVESLREKYTNVVNIPQYLPTMAAPPRVKDLYDDTRTRKLLGRIWAADIPEDVALFLEAAAHRHTVVDFRNVAEFYAHAGPELQALMEEQALVIIDVGDAIANGYMRLNAALEAIVAGEEGGRDAAAAA